MVCVRGSLAHKWHKASAAASAAGDPRPGDTRRWTALWQPGFSLLELPDPALTKDDEDDGGKAQGDHGRDAGGGGVEQYFTCKDKMKGF